MKSYYFDYAAATPVDPRVLKVWNETTNLSWANPSSPHKFGRYAKGVLEESREKIAKIISCSPGEIYFVNSATEANNLAIISFMKSTKSSVLVSDIEHASIHNIPGVEYIPYSFDLEITLENIKNTITDSTHLISLIWVHNELGTVLDIMKVIEYIREINIERVGLKLPKIFLHVDGSQAPNYIQIDLSKVKIDLLTLSACKLYSPRGSALLFVRNNVPIKPIIYGGGQEKSIWPGTQNVSSIAAFAMALEIAQFDQKWLLKINKLSEYTINHFKNNTEIDTIINTKNVPGIIMLGFKKTDQDTLLTFLDLNNIYINSSSSCSSGGSKVPNFSKYLKENYSAFLRISLGRMTKKEDVDYLLKKIQDFRKI
jgi:cysteine desulfurase